MQTAKAIDPISVLRSSIRSSIDALNKHQVYGKLQCMDDVRVFMQYHAFAVWDFMSLVKALQTHYAPTSVPWFAPRQTTVSRFINEIVLAEESDVDINGNFCSHYQMYLDAMKEVGANTEHIETFVGALRDGAPLFETIAELNLPVELKKFLIFTFETIGSRDIHKIAASFTFGREDIIPEMFLQVLKNSDELQHAPKFKYYLERHVELDGDEHGPMALKLMEAACGQDLNKWQEAAECANSAIDVRINLWSMIERRISATTENELGAQVI